MTSQASAAAIAPGSSRRHGGLSLVSTRKASRKNARLTPIETASTASIRPGPYEVAAVLIAPSSVPAIVMAPSTAIQTSARTRRSSAFERRWKGTPQMWSSALSSARHTPIPAQIAKKPPTTSAGTLPRSDCTLSCSCGPITGKSASAESSTSRCSPRSPSSA